ncbi:uncharacterized protein [Cardiocondyla obscurior]|uniref:uncharacterized protein n=1 Tax=Cardiocondyla obscurior TaxID=286306 RepID=UPI0039658AA8
MYLISCCSLLLLTLVACQAAPWPQVTEEKLINQEKTIFSKNSIEPNEKARTIKQLRKLCYEYRKGESIQVRCSDEPPIIEVCSEVIMTHNDTKCKDGRLLRVPDDSNWFFLPPPTAYVEVIPQHEIDRTLAIPKYETKCQPQSRLPTLRPYFTSDLKILKPRVMTYSNTAFNSMPYKLPYFTENNPSVMLNKPIYFRSN